MRRSVLLLLALACMAGCVDEPGMGSRPAASHPTSGGPKLAIRKISNKSQQFGLEDSLATSLRDEFLRDGRYALVPENEADDVVAITITRYLLTPLAYDASLSPISYKLRIIADVQMLERATNRELWIEKNLEGAITYPNAILAGGQTEPQAQATIWTVLAPMIVLRVANGFDAAPPPAPSTSTAPNPVIPVVK